MAKVYVPNKSHHDFSKAAEFGQLVFLTEGRVNTYKVNELTSQIMAAMADSSGDDFIVVSSLPILMGLASAVFAGRHGVINYLIFNGREYETRNLRLFDFDGSDIF